MEIHFSTIPTSLLHGLILGMILVIVTGGLTIIFAMLEVLIFAHGSLYMPGGYLGFTLATITGSFWLALILAPMIVGFIGFLIEFFTLRPLHGRPPLHHLLLTFGISVMIQKAIKFIWGNDVYTVSIPGFLSGATRFLGISYPTYICGVF